MMLMSSNDIKELQVKVDALLGAFDALHGEVKALRSARAEWEKERITLVAHNDLATKKVQAILVQLRKMEAGE